MNERQYRFKEPAATDPAARPIGIHRRRTHVSRVKLIRCVRCQYDLMGLPAGTTCPECGQVEADISTRIVEDPPEYSWSRIQVLLITAVSYPVLGLIAERYWFWLYATSRWGPKPNSSELSLSGYFWSGLLCILYMLPMVSLLPWKLTRSQMLLVIGPACVLMFVLNFFAVRVYWSGDSVMFSRL